MSQIDKLQIYEEYRKCGYTESQAACAVKVLDNSFDEVSQARLKVNGISILIIIVFLIIAFGLRKLIFEKK